MKRTVWLIALLALAACTKDKDVDKPRPLAAFQATLRIEKLWSASVGGDKKPMRLGLGLAVEDGKVYAAGSRGEVVALELKSGRRIWATRTKLPLAGATAVGDGLVVVGSSDGDVLALDIADGKQRWRVNVGGEVLAAPAIAPRVILVRGVDGKLHGLAPADGHELWQQEQPVPRLSLRGTSSPEIAGDVAICGYDNGRLVASNLTDGSSAWETQVSPPHGKTELERLVDIDADTRVSGNDVYVVGFQGKIAMLALDTGQIWWQHDASSYRALGIDDDNLYVSSAEGDVIAFKRRTGAELWRQSALGHRGLSAPAVGVSYLVVADYKGFVHWLDKSSGAIIARAKVGKSRVTNPPVVVDDEVLVINDRGAIDAFRAIPLPGRARPAGAPSATKS